MVDLLPRLKAKGHHVDLLLFDGTDTQFRRDVEAAGIKVFDLGKGGSVYSPLRLMRLLPYMKRYDVVHTHNTAPQLFAALGSLIFSVKLLSTEHNTSNRRRKWKWYTVIDRWMYNRYSKIICISQKAEENLRAHLGKCNADILTINNGVNVYKYANASPSTELEQIAPDSRKMIMVAGFRLQKDQDTIIKSLKHLPDRFHLFLVGDGSRRGELETLIKEEKVIDRVHLLGLRTDVPELLHAADYVVMSSHYEGLSLSSVEGMSVGKPFLASDVDGLREVVSGAGILFPHHDTHSFVKEIQKLEEDQKYYQIVATQCFERAKHYEISFMSDCYNKLYTNL